MTTSSTFRDMIDRVSPSWLRASVGSRYLYAIALQLDILADQAQQGIKRRFPQSAAKALDDAALALIGLDRGILRGSSESTAAYGLRLTRAIDDWRLAGSAFSVLNQIQGYLTPNATRIRIVNNTGCWWTLNADGTKSVVQSPQIAGQGNWNWDNLGTQWSRFWVIIYCNSGKPFAVGPNWGDGGFTYGIPGTTWGSTATVDQVRSIQSIVASWKSADSRCMNIILAFDPASFDPTGANGAPLPDGTWGTWAINGATKVEVASRLATARYWDGPP